ncbi:MAG: VOC family protein, partial [Rhodospirillales bacterium]
MLNVKLHHLSFTTDNLEKMIAFYRDQMGMVEIRENGGDIILQAKNRIMHLTNGPSNQLNYAAYGMPSQSALMDLRKR